MIFILHLLPWSAFQSFSVHRYFCVESVVTTQGPYCSNASDVETHVCVSAVINPAECIMANEDAFFKYRFVSVCGEMRHNSVDNILWVRSILESRRKMQIARPNCESRLIYYISTYFPSLF
jgi:hypothetical protein